MRLSAALVPARPAAAARVVVLVLLLALVRQATSRWRLAPGVDAAALAAAAVVTRRPAAAECVAFARAPGSILIL